MHIHRIDACRWQEQADFLIGIEVAALTDANKCSESGRRVEVRTVINIQVEIVVTIRQLVAQLEAQVELVRVNDKRYDRDAVALAPSKLPRGIFVDEPRVNLGSVCVAVRSRFAIKAMHYGGVAAVVAEGDGEA